MENSLLIVLSWYLLHSYLIHKHCCVEYPPWWIYMSVGYEAYYSRLLSKFALTSDPNVAACL